MSDAAAAEYCRRVMRLHARSFYFATRVLPLEKRRGIEALYAFFRGVDDAVDEGDASSEERRSDLQRFRNAIQSLSGSGERSSEPWFAALSSAFERYELDTQPLLELIDGCESDLGSVNFERMSDLERYARAVAGTVGRSVMPVLGACDEEAITLGERLGVAMQLTNVLRDVDEDRRLGRNYLPMREYPGAASKDVMRFVALRARAYYESGRAVAKCVPNDGSRAALLMAATFYEGILTKLERRGFEPVGRAYVGSAAKWGLAAKCLVSAYTGLAIIK
jgi:15-cis-phytoene synthase